MKATASPFNEVIPTTAPIPAETERAALGHLLILRDRGELTDEAMTEIGQMLGLIPEVGT